MRQTGPSRVLHAAWWCLVLILMHSYSGTLIASLTSPKLVKVADSLAELTEQTQVEWSVRRGSVSQLVFLQAKSGVYERAGRLLKGRPDLLLGSDKEGLALVRTGRYAFIKGLSFLEFAIADDLEKNGKCSFGLAGDGFLNAHIAWIFQKNSPYTPLVNTRLMLMAQSGLLAKWRREFFPPPNECTKPSPKGPRRLALKDLSGCITLAVAGVLLAAMVLLGELLVVRITTKKKK